MYLKKPDGKATRSLWCLQHPGAPHIVEIKVIDVCTPLLIYYPYMQSCHKKGIIVHDELYRNSLK